MNISEALQFAQKRLDKVSYHLEMTERLPCRSFYEKQQEMLIQTVVALHEKVEREKGCKWCKGLIHGGLADGETIKELEIRSEICAGYFCPRCGRKLV